MKILKSISLLILLICSSIIYGQNNNVTNFNLPPGAKFLPKQYEKIDYSDKINDASVNESISKNYLSKFTATELDALSVNKKEVYDYYIAALNYFNSLSDKVKSKFTVKELWHIYMYDQQLKNNLLTIN